MVEEKHKLQLPLAILFHLSGEGERCEVAGSRLHCRSHNPGAWAPQKAEPKSQARIFPLLSTQYHYIINALLTTANHSGNYCGNHSGNYLPQLPFTQYSIITYTQKTKAILNGKKTV